MFLKNRYNLWKFRRSTRPSTQFKNTLFLDLDKAWGSAYGKAPWYASLGAHPVVAVAVVIILLGGGGAYAYTNPDITEGTMLYPVKQVIEDIEEITKVTPEAKAQFLLKQITRREAEKKILQKQNIVKKVEKDIENESVRTQAPQIAATKSVEDRTAVRAEQEKIEKTERAIDRAVQKLEESSKILEKNGTKNSKLRVEIKNQVEQRKEEIKNNLENRIEFDLDRQENREEELEHDQEKN